MPKPDGNKPEAGSSPQHPIVVEGVPAFRRACVFNFADLRTHLLLLAEETLGDVDKILLGREFNIKEWLAPACIRFCQRQQPANAEEARKLGVESFILLWHMREKRWNRDSPFVVGEYYCGSCIGVVYMRGDKECGGCRAKLSEAHQRYDYPAEWRAPTLQQLMLKLKQR